jgi:hypothetical protein
VTSVACIVFALVLWQGQGASGLSSFLYFTSIYIAPVVSAARLLQRQSFPFSLLRERRERRERERER